MAENKKDLKSFMRVDGQGRVIAGSNVLRKNKPKIGKWIQIQTYVCCDPYFPLTPGGGGTPDFVEEVLGVGNTPFVCDTLGTAEDFAVLSDQTITNTGNTIITGDLGLHPGTSVTGFPPGSVIGEQHITDIVAQQAQIYATAAFTCLNDLVTTGSVDGDIGGETLVSGVYSVASSLGITGELTLDGGNDPDSVWIFKIPSTLTTASSALVTLINGASACNVYWLVGSSATLGSNTDMIGNIIAVTSITFGSGADLTGRAIALGGAVTLDDNIITSCACSVNPCS